MTEKPLLTEDTHAILHRLLDKVDAGRTRVQLKLNRAETPELYNFDDQYQVDSVWNDLIELEKCAVIILKIQPTQRQGYEIYHGGSLTLRLDAEELLRHWLKRSAIDPHILLWHDALKKYESVYEDQGLALKKELVTFLGKRYEQVAAAFAQIASELISPMTLRQLSARCFWGESKFLDNYAKESLVVATFPSLAHNIRRRPLLLTVFLPSEFNQVLFVENQDTFLELATLANNRLGIVYIGGYRGTAMRSREPGQAVFAYLNPVTKNQAETFENFWLGRNALSCYFWGDLDYAGMCILEALKKVFPMVEAWQPGYQPMVDKLNQGQGHSPGVQNKEKQFMPGNIGCNYSDHILMTAIEANGAFYDQEAINIHELII